MMKKIFRRLFNNFWYKLLSLALAVLVWGMIQGEQILELNREIDVNIVVPEGMAARNEAVRVKAATVRGPRVLMTEIPERFEADIIVPKGVLGKYRVRIDKDDIRKWNDRLQITIHDPFVTLYVDEKVSRTVPVKEVIQGSPADGFFMRNVNVKPKTVVITGLKGDISKIKNVNTEPIDITGLQENRSFETEIVPPGGLTDIDFSVRRVNVSIELADSMENKRFAPIPIEVVGGEYDARIRPKFVSIVVQGTPNTLNFLKNTDFKAFVEGSNLGPGEYERDIKVKIPADTVLIENFPEKAHVSVSGKKLIP